jgi:hypothetical protein
VEDLSRAIWGGWPAAVFQFWLERGGDGMKYCQKIKQRQRARLGSIGRKCDTAQQRGDMDREVAPGSEREETTPVVLTRILLSRKMKKKSTWLIQLLQMDGEYLKQ